MIIHQHQHYSNTTRCGKPVVVGNSTTNNEEVTCLECIKTVFPSINSENKKEENIGITTHQKMEPCVASLTNNNGKISFKIIFHHSTFDGCLEEVIKQYNRFAKSTGQKLLKIDQIELPEVDLNSENKENEEKEDIKKQLSLKLEKKHDEKMTKIPERSLQYILYKTRKTKKYSLKQVSEALGLELEEYAKYETGQKTFKDFEDGEQEFVVKLGDILDFDEQTYNIIQKRLKKEK